MKKLSPAAKFTTVIMCLALLIVFASATAGDVLSDEPPEPVASSTFAIAEPDAGDPPETFDPLGAELELFVYLPLAVQVERLSSYAQQVVEITNQERARAGCAPLRVNPQLVQAAQAHSEDMAFNDFFSHTGSDGSAPWDRIEDTGYDWREAGENIAAGYTTPQAVMTGWMNSDGHRANILRCSYEEIGVGYVYIQSDPGSVNYRHYWTQVFARPG